MIGRLCDQAAGKDIAVVGLYCDFPGEQEQSSANILGAMLKQLPGGGGILDHIREASQKAKTEFGGRGLRVPVLVEIMNRAVTSLSHVFVCIDASDESPPQHR